MTMLKVGGLEDFAVEEEKIMSTLEFKNCNSSFDVGEAISVRPRRARTWQSSKSWKAGFPLLF